MDQDPTGIKDSVIPKLRASLKMSKKSVDDLLAEVVEQVDRIESDENDPLVPQSMIMIILGNSKHFLFKERFC